MKKIINKIINFLYSIESDKLLHLIAGIIITELISGIIFICFHPFYGGAIIGLAFAIIIGFVKEIIDKHLPNHVYNIKDFLYTAIGSIIGFLLTILIIS